jgi:transposase
VSKIKKRIQIAVLLLMIINFRDDILVLLCITANGCSMWVKALGLDLQVIPRSEEKQFVVQPKRWIVERTFAWLEGSRRMAKDFEINTNSVEAFFKLAIIAIIVKWL